MHRRLSLIIALCLWVGSAASLTGQATVARAVGGAALGAAVSVPVTMAYVTIRAHTGDYIFNGEEGLRKLIWIPAVLVGTGTGAALAASESFTFVGAALGTIGGGALGAAAGRGIAELTASTEAGRWGGLVIGMGFGVAAGAVIGGFRGGSDATDDPVVPLSVSIPLF